MISYFMKIPIKEIKEWSIKEIIRQYSWLKTIDEVMKEEAEENG